MLNLLGHVNDDGYCFKGHIYDVSVSDDFAFLVSPDISLLMNGIMVIDSGKGLYKKGVPYISYSRTLNRLYS